MTTSQDSLGYFVAVEMPNPDPATHDTAPALPFGSGAMSQSFFILDRMLMNCQGPLMYIAARPAWIWSRSALVLPGSVIWAAALCFQKRST